MTYDLKCPVGTSSQTLDAFVFRSIDLKTNPELLLFSEKDYALCELVEKGVWIKRGAFLPEGVSNDSVKKVNATIGPDPRFSPTLDGYWVRVVTVKEVFNQFGGTWGIIAAIHTGKDRLIWWSEQVQASLPKVYVIGEDGHNEDVIERAHDMGYKSSLVEDCLVMVRDSE